MSNVYNFYMTTYAPKSSTRYDSHKKSELRSVYNSIVKMNKESPLYILDTSKDSQQFAVSMKENARELRNTIASLGGLDDEELLNKKVAYSSNENIATATYVGASEVSEDVPPYEIEVKHLASPQINMGKFLPSEESIALTPSTYSFDVGIDDLNYEFQFNIKSTDTNRDVQERLSRLINNANIGMSAQVITDDEGNSTLRMESNATGLKDGKTYLFKISDNQTSKTSGSVNYFGLDYVAAPSSNASFVVNGEEVTTASNHFTLENTYELQLTGVSSEEGETASIGLRTDVESLTENINTLVRGYNSFLKAVAEYSENQPKSNRLFNEMSSVARVYAQGLTSVGLNLNLDGTLEVNSTTLQKRAMGDDAREVFSSMKGFTNSVLRKANQVSLNPMNYVNNVIVAYKNPGKNFASPYITSAYSGMMFNSYC
ncbi:MAG: flagellar filament capping protein FliD [Lachnospiraceae bacterium]|nr:flagellar filament capping protein FliD [Lachnospiraceae bacterium]